MFDDGASKSIQDLLSLVTKLLQYSYQEICETPIKRLQHPCQEITAFLPRDYNIPVKRLQHPCQKIHKTSDKKMIEYLNFFLLCTLVTLLCYLYVRTKRNITLLKMVEENIDNLISISYDASKSDSKRQKLLECILTRNSKQYLGKVYTEGQINKLSDEEVDKLFSNYEAKLSGQMVKSLGKSIINMYSMGACTALGISKQDALNEDLETDPFLNSALQRFTFELYYRFGLFLAPLSVGLITSKHYLN